MTVTASGLFTLGVHCAWLDRGTTRRSDRPHWRPNGPGEVVEGLTQYLVEARAGFSSQFDVTPVRTEVRSDEHSEAVMVGLRCVPAVDRIGANSLGFWHVAQTSHR